MSTLDAAEQEQRVFFRTEDGLTLAGLYSPPKSSMDLAQIAGVADTALVLTHPHPKLGGNLHNNVVTDLAAGFHARGFPTLRFNFRGVAPSEGSSSWTGTAERADVVSAIHFVTTRSRWVPRPASGVVVVGYSFGAAVAALPSATITATLSCRVRGYAAVSYPAGALASVLLGQHWRKGIRELLCPTSNTASSSSIPTLFVLGGRDQFTGVSSLRNALQKLLPLPLPSCSADPNSNATATAKAKADGCVRTPWSMVVVPQADHFWRDYDVSVDVVRWVCDQVLPQVTTQDKREHT